MKTRAQVIPQLLLAFTLTFNGTYPMLDNAGDCENPVPVPANGDSIRVDYHAELFGNAGAFKVDGSVRGTRGERYTVRLDVPYRYLYKVTVRPVKLNNMVPGCLQYYPPLMAK